MHVFVKGTMMGPEAKAACTALKAKSVNEDGSDFIVNYSMKLKEPFASDEFLKNTWLPAFTKHTYMPENFTCNIEDGHLNFTG